MTHASYVLEPELEALCHIQNLLHNLFSFDTKAKKVLTISSSFSKLSIVMVWEFIIGSYFLTEADLGLIVENTSSVRDRLVNGVLSLRLSTLHVLMRSRTGWTTSGPVSALKALLLSWLFNKIRIKIKMFFWCKNKSYFDYRGNILAGSFFKHSSEQLSAVFMTVTCSNMNETVWCLCESKWR